MPATLSPEDAFLAALREEARVAFAGAGIASILATHHTTAHQAYPDLAITATTFAQELARRLDMLATPDALAGLRADHVYLAVACAGGDAEAIRRFETEFLDEIEITGARLRARPDQIDEIRSHVRRVLFVSEPGRPAAVTEYSGRGDLRSYLRVITTRELVRVINKGRRDIGVSEDAILDMLSPTDDVALAYLRERYRSDVNAAIRAALASLAAEPRALLRYSLVDGWTVDRIGALYGIHRATAARRVAAAREALAEAIRGELAARLSIDIEEVDSIVRLVQSRVDLSLERLLAH
jgi:RNA polymerase sigma-70 factor, ECF subfamily